MRCIECQLFQRLDTRVSPSEVVCGKFPHGIAIDTKRGCGLGTPKPKNADAWKVSPGMNWRKA